MKWYVSFGQQYNLRNSLMLFEGVSELEVRMYMLEVYKNKYAFIYNEEQGFPQLEKYNLSIVYPGEDLYERIN